MATWVKCALTTSLQIILEHSVFEQSFLRRQLPIWNFSQLEWWWSLLASVVCDAVLFCTGSRENRTSLECPWNDPILDSWEKMESRLNCRPTPSRLFSRRPCDTEWFIRTKKGMVSLNSCICSFILSYVRSLLEHVLQFCLFARRCWTDSVSPFEHLSLKLPNVWGVTLVFHGLPWDSHQGTVTDSGLTLSWTF